MAAFAAVRWQPNDRLSFQAEYSSDDYRLEQHHRMFKERAPVNVGLQYRIRPGTTLGAYYMYGSELGVTASFAFNPRRPPHSGDRSSAPPPVVTRPDVIASWGAQANGSSSMRLESLNARIGSALADQGMRLTGAKLGENRLRVEVENTRYDAVPQAIGRVGRILTREAPPWVETFEIVPVVDGLRTSKITLRRDDLERFEG